MSLSELDRPIVQWRYEKWDRAITIQALSAAEFAAIKDSICDDDEKLTSTDMKLAAGICATGVRDPQHSREEWLTGAAPFTVTDISNKIMSLSNIDTEEAKKN